MFGIPVSTLPAVNASLNGLATVLLVLGYLLIKRRRETAHKWTMLGAFAVSTLFLASYLAYHFQKGAATPFSGPRAAAYAYYAMLISHIVLAATVPAFAGMTIYYGLRDQRQKHLRIARWAFPIWLYVSVTGVLIYLVLYQLYPANIPRAIIAPVGTY